MKRPIPPGWSVDYGVPSHLAVATFIFTIFYVERYVKFNNKKMYIFLIAIVLIIIMYK